MQFFPLGESMSTCITDNNFVDVVLHPINPMNIVLFFVPCSCLGGLGRSCLGKYIKDYVCVLVLLFLCLILFQDLLLLNVAYGAVTGVFFSLCCSWSFALANTACRPGSISRHWSSSTTPWSRSCADSAGESILTNSTISYSFVHSMPVIWNGQASCVYLSFMLMHHVLRKNIEKDLRTLSCDLHMHM